MKYKKYRPYKPYDSLHAVRGHTIRRPKAAKEPASQHTAAALSAPPEPQPEDQYTAAAGTNAQFRDMIAKAQGG